MKSAWEKIWEQIVKVCVWIGRAIASYIASCSGKRKVEVKEDDTKPTSVPSTSRGQ